MSTVETKINLQKVRKKYHVWAGCWPEDTKSIPHPGPTAGTTTMNKNMTELWEEGICHREMGEKVKPSVSYTVERARAADMRQ